MHPKTAGAGMIFGRIKRFFSNLVSQERCSQRLVLSCCAGVYIAFSPFVGLHTAMVFLFSWLFALNAGIVLAASLFINNPWTMVPVYMSGYMIGDWLFSFCGVDSMSCNPSWLARFNALIAAKIGMSGLSLPAFLIGGNLLGLVISGILYPVLRRFLVRN